VDATGSGSCPVWGFGISGVEPPGSATRESVNCFVVSDDDVAGALPSACCT
jgi:hypothetical protein